MKVSRSSGVGCACSEHGVDECCVVHERKPKELKLKAAASSGETDACLQERERNTMNENLLI